MAEPPVSRLQGMRRFRRMQQAELARLIGVHPNTLANWEHGRAEPTLRDLVNVALVLECQLGDLVDNEELAFRPRERGAGAPAAPEDLARERLELPRTEWKSFYGPDSPPSDRISRGVQADFREMRRRGIVDE